MTDGRSTSSRGRSAASASFPVQGSGHHFDRFRLLRPLGEGGMGAVFEAHDELLDRKVAVKQLHGDADDLHQQRLLREAQALARLSHPNVVQVYDAGISDDGLFIAMELVSGRTLRDWQREPHPWRDCVDVYAQAARGLAAAHAAGIVHRDFKPANCILDDEGRVRVLDFGLARGTHELDEPHAVVEPAASSSLSGSLDRQLTQTGMLLGTPAYMAPEQMVRAPVDARCDQYSLCVSLYEAIYGVRPYDGAHGMVHLLGTEPSFSPASTHAGRPRTPKWLRRLISRGLQVHPDRRFASMDELLAVIEGQRRRQRSRRVGAVVLSLGLVGTWAVVSSQRERPCEGLRDEPMPAWTDEARASAEQAMLAASSELAAPAWESVRSGLDAYAEQWVESRAQACEATRVEHTVSEEVLALRQACLDRRALHVHALVDLLQEADAGVVAHAGQAVRSLPPLSTCHDVELLQDGYPLLPEHLDEAATEVRTSIAQSWAAGMAGQANQGMMMAELAVLDAEELGEDGTPLLAEARLNRGRLHRFAQRLPEAREDLEAVLELSEQVGDQATAIDALRDLTTSASAGDDLVSLAALMPVFRGKLRRFPDRPRLDADRKTLEGLLAVGQGEAEAAVEAFEQAAEIYRSLGSSAAAELSHGLVQLGRAHVQLDHDEQAQRIFEDAADTARSEGLFPMVAMADDQLAHLHYAKGRSEQAEVVARRSLELTIQIHGPRAPATISTRLLLAELAELRGDVDAARELLELVRRSLGPQVPTTRRAQVYVQLGRSRLHRGELQEALELYRRAREEWSEVPNPKPTDLATLDVNIGDCLMQLGKLDAAVEPYRRSLATLELHTATDDPLRVFPLLGLGHIWVEQGDPDRGIPFLRQAWEIEKHGAHGPVVAAFVQSELGAALLESEAGGVTEIAEAVALLESALETYRAEGDTESVALFEALLEECGARCSAAVNPETR